MSSFAGTSITVEQEKKDPAFQLATPEGTAPDMQAVLDAFKRTMTDNQPFVDQCRLNYETRYALWNNQSADGKKHAREANGKNDPTPWDGASDLRVFMVDNAINYKIARNSLALKKATMVAVPVNGGDIERASTVANFMRWMVHTQIPNLDREQELLSNYLLEKGVALTGQFWETKQEKTLMTVRVADIQQAFPNVNVLEILNDKRMEDKFVAALSEYEGFSVSKPKARKMLKELRAKGVTTAHIAGPVISRPIVRAFCLDRDVFIPAWANDLESAPYIFRVEYFTAEQLRAFVRTDDWDADWVEEAILRCRGHMITSIPDSTLQPISRSFTYIDRKIPYTDLVGVVYAYRRLSDEEGVPGIYLTIFNPHLPEDNKQGGYAYHDLLGYAHGEYPFVKHYRETLSRKFHDTRGIPEPGKSWQDQIKAHRDSRIDAASVAILPPLLYPLGRPPTRWGPGARIPERRPGEYHYADRPGQDVNTDESEATLVRTWNDYVGQTNPQDDPTMANVMGQHDNIKWLEGWSHVYRQCWKLFQQYGDEKVFFRVLGIQNGPPEVMTKGNPNEDYRFWLTFDTLMLSPDQMVAKLKAMVEFAQSTDHFQQVDYSKFLQAGLEMMDSSIAERVILPQQSATQQAVAQIQSDLAQIYGGIPHDLKPGTPPQLATQVLQQYTQQPDIVQRYQQDQGFKQRIDNYAKQIKFSGQQQQNAQIGRIGAAPAGTPQATTPGTPQNAS